MRKAIGYLVLLVMLVVAMSSLHLTGGKDAAGTGRLLVRVSQLDPGQYRSTVEYTTWAYSTCSTAAMTEVMDYYSRHYRITDVLAVESRMGAITPQQGLLADAGIARTVAAFGFQTTWGYQFSLDQLIAAAHGGTPVMVAFPPQRYPGGHLVVVTGGNRTTVFLADSSRWNRRFLSRTRFLQWWAGFAAVVTPREGA